MGKSNLKKGLFKLTGPIFIETLLLMLMGAVDTFMLGQYDDNAVGAVGVVNQLVTFAFLIFQIINVGTTVLCSQFLGAGRRDKMIQVTGVALLINIVCGIVVSAGLYFGASPLLKMMGLRGEMMPYGMNYMEIVGAFAFFQAIHMTISASLRADKKAIYPMLVIMVVNVVNILGNYTLIFGNFGAPELGVEGAAISTVLGRGTAMVLLLIILFRKHISSFPMKLFRPFPWHELKNLLKIGVPSAGENMSYNIQQIVLVYFINQLGNVELVTRSYIVNFVMFVYLFAICVAQGGSILIGHLIGEKKPHAAFVLGKYVMRSSLIVSVLLSLLWALLGNTLFTSLTNNTEIIELGCTILMVDILVEAGKSINIYATTALRSTGDVFFPFYLGVVVQWGVGILFGYMFGIYFGWGLIGIWFSMFLDESIRGLVFVHRWNSMKWMKKSFV
ncbi:MAG: MATE family efflux transporter [Bacteroidaceae bacterium]|nr:MATE family efflux transporter [Candidatus Minthousia equi]MCQ2246434.1 MATE family efflux transporter [Bacteroidaceae bacterium]